MAPFSYSLSTSGFAADSLFRFCLILSSAPGVVLIPTSPTWYQHTPVHRYLPLLRTHSPPFRTEYSVLIANISSHLQENMQCHTPLLQFQSFIMFALQYKCNCISKVSLPCMLQRLQAPSHHLSEQSTGYQYLLGLYRRTLRPLGF